MSRKSQEKLRLEEIPLYRIIRYMIKRSTKSYDEVAEQLGIKVHMLYKMLNPECRQEFPAQKLLPLMTFLNSDLPIRWMRRQFTIAMQKQQKEEVP